MCTRYTYIGLVSSYYIYRSTNCSQLLNSVNTYIVVLWLGRACIRLLFSRGYYTLNLREAKWLSTFLKVNNFAETRVHYPSWSTIFNRIHCHVTHFSESRILRFSVLYNTYYLCIIPNRFVVELIGCTYNNKIIKMFSSSGSPRGRFFTEIEVFEVLNIYIP